MSEISTIYPYISLRLCPLTPKLLASVQHWGRQESDAHVMWGQAHVGGEKATNCMAPGGQREAHSHAAPDASPYAPSSSPKDHAQMGPFIIIIISIGSPSWKKLYYKLHANIFLYKKNKYLI